MSFKFLLKAILVIGLSATIAAWLKMTVPGLSIGYFPLWKNETLRNIAGIFISMPLLELYYLGPMYLLALTGFALVTRKWSAVKHSHGLAIAIGAAIAAGSYVLYKVNFYLRCTMLYDIHSGGGRPWYSWVEYPQDWQLLVIYMIAGAAGGWLYWRLIYRQPAIMEGIGQALL